TLFDSHFDDLERLAGDLLVLRDGEPLPARWSDPAWSTPETRRVAQSVNQALGAEHLPGAPHHEQRLAAVVAALDEGLLLLTGRGLVSLINAPAAALFPSPPQVGTSGLRLFEAESLARA